MHLIPFTFLLVPWQRSMVVTAANDATTDALISLTRDRITARTTFQTRDVDDYLSSIAGGLQSSDFDFLPSLSDVSNVITTLFSVAKSLVDQRTNALAIGALMNRTSDTAGDRLDELKTWFTNTYGQNATTLYIDNQETLADAITELFTAQFFPSSSSVVYDIESDTTQWRYRATLLYLRTVRVLKLNRDAATATFGLGHLSLISTHPSEWSQVTGFSYDAQQYPSLGRQRRRQRQRRRRMEQITHQRSTSTPTITVPGLPSQHTDTQSPSASPQSPTSQQPTTTSPVSAIDWRAVNGVLAPVQNQGSCGSCWAFASTCVVESRFAIENNNQLTELSQQQLISCDTNGVNDGCNGGNPAYAFKYMYKNTGVTSLAVYPYASVSGYAPQCNTANAQTQIIMAGTTQVMTPTTDAQVMQALQTGPVSIAIVSSTPCFQHYTNGVLLDANCPISFPPQLDHAVVIVGYSTVNGIDVWIVRNSWSASWGVNGYVYLQRGVPYPGTLGCLAAVSYPSKVQLSVNCNDNPPAQYCSQVLNGNPPVDISSSSTSSLRVHHLGHVVVLMLLLLLLPGF